jgi:ferrous iron transport protein A
MRTVLIDLHSMTSTTSALEALPVNRIQATPQVRRLDQAPLRQVFTVRGVDADPQVPERARQLEEIGFFPGEQVEVVAHGYPGREPLVVRVGQSTFALRGAEAACVQIEGRAGVPGA